MNGVCDVATRRIRCAPVKHQHIRPLMTEEFTQALCSIGNGDNRDSRGGFQEAAEPFSFQSVIVYQNHSYQQATSVWFR